jgi:excisionase family DNA binding protein
MQNGSNSITLLSKKDAAARLNVSSRTLDRHIEAGVGPAVVRIGSRVLIPADALAAWVAERIEHPRAA